PRGAIRRAGGDAHAPRRRAGAEARSRGGGDDPTGHPPRVVERRGGGAPRPRRAPPGRPVRPVPRDLLRAGARGEDRPAGAPDPPPDGRVATHLRRHDLPGEPAPCGPAGAGRLARPGGPPPRVRGGLPVPPAGASAPRGGMTRRSTPTKRRAIPALLARRRLRCPAPASSPVSRLTGEPFCGSTLPHIVHIATED